jgi:plastocyanin
VPVGIHNRVKVMALLDVAIIVLAIVLASSLVPFVGRSARASSFVIVDVSEITPALFDPQGVNISVGDYVIWFGIHDAHSTISDTGQAEYWDSGSLTEGLSFVHTFTHAGNFTYHSTFPEDAGQVGWVYVQQPVPEFPDSMIYIALAAAVTLALLVERRLRA